MADAAPVPKLVWLQIRGMIGQPAEITEIELRAASITPHGSYRVQVREGRKWCDAEVSPTRIGRASVDIYQNSISGGVWFLEEDREAATTNLQEAAREALVARIDLIQATLDSIPSHAREPEAPGRAPGS